MMYEGNHPNPSFAGGAISISLLTPNAKAWLKLEIGVSKVYDHPSWEGGVGVVSSGDLPLNSSRQTITRLLR